MKKTRQEKEAQSAMPWQEELKNLPALIRTWRADGKAALEGWRFAAKPFIALVFLHLLAFGAIFRANFNYIDDMGRAYGGYQDWGGFSRYLSNFFSTLIHGGDFLTDISPLPQLIAILLLSLSGIIVIEVLNGKKSISCWQVIAVLPLGISPYFLECISYKFDSPYMALSILVSVLPLLFCRQEPYLYGLVAFTCTWAMCTTYQAASGIFPMLVALVCFKRWNQGERGKEVGKFLGVSVLGYGLGLVFFYIVLMRPANGYVSNSLPAFPELPLTIFENEKHYFSLIRQGFPRPWLVLCLLLAACFLYAAIQNSARGKGPALLAAAVSLAAMALLCFGLYPLLAKPLFVPRAMYGLGALIAFLAVFDVSAPKACLAKLFSLALSWMFITFSLTYGNALAAQKEYADFRIEAVAEALGELPQFSQSETREVQLAGSIGYAPVIRGAIAHYPVLASLVPVTLQENWFWGKYQLTYYYGIPNLTTTYDMGMDVSMLPILADTVQFTIRGENGRFLVELK